MSEALYRYHMHPAGGGTDTIEWFVPLTLHHHGFELTRNAPTSNWYRYRRIVDQGSRCRLEQRLSHRRASLGAVTRDVRGERNAPCHGGGGARRHRDPAGGRHISGRRRRWHGVHRRERRQEL